MSESLTQEQFEWMRQQHDYIDLAFRWREAQTIRDLADGAYYKSVFGDMDFADAYQSYEDMLAKTGLRRNRNLKHCQKLRRISDGL